jgi:hypothetical protein
MILLPGLSRGFTGENGGWKHLRDEVVCPHMEAGIQVIVCMAVWDINGTRRVSEVPTGDVRYDEVEYWSGTPTTLDRTKIDRSELIRSLEALGASNFRLDVFDFDKNSAHWLDNVPIQTNHIHTLHQVVSKRSMWFLRDKCMKLATHHFPEYRDSAVLLTRPDCRYHSPVLLVEPPDGFLCGGRRFDFGADSDVVYSHMRADGNTDDMYVFGSYHAIQKYTQVFLYLDSILVELSKQEDVPLQSEDIVRLNATKRGYRHVFIPMAVSKIGDG